MAEMVNKVWNAAAAVKPHGNSFSRILPACVSFQKEIFLRFLPACENIV